MTLFLNIAWELPLIKFLVLFSEKRKWSLNLFLLVDYLQKKKLIVWMHRWTLLSKCAYLISSNWSNTSSFFSFRLIHAIHFIAISSNHSLLISPKFGLRTGLAGNTHPLQYRSTNSIFFSLVFQQVFLLILLCCILPRIYIYLQRSTHHFGYICFLWMSV